MKTYDFFVQHNPSESREIIVDTYVKEVSDHVDDESLVVLDTGENSHKIKLSTFKKIFRKSPNMFHVTYDLLLCDSSVSETFQSKKDWLNALLTLDISYDDRYIQFINLGKLKLKQTWHEVFLENERNKLDTLNAYTHGKSIAFTNGKMSANTVLVGRPPHICDIMAIRSELFDAMPDTIIEKLCKSHIVVHFGPISKPRSSFTHIDSRVLLGDVPFDIWSMKPFI